MIRLYACTDCKAELFRGNLKSLLEKRRSEAPTYIEMTCPECGHVNQLTYDPATELKKSAPQATLNLSDTVE